MAEFMFHEFRLDVAGAQLWRGVDRIALPPKPFAVLRLLVERAGELVTKGHLLDAVWSSRHVSESSLSVSINALRAALGDDPRAPRCIETVNRLGYRFIAPVEKAQRKTAKEDAAATLPAGDAPIGLPPRLQLRSRHGLFGRTREQSTMARSWEAARRGERQLVMIAGEPGIGKTRLAAETARQAHGDGAVVLLGSCDADIGLPYRPFVEALQHFVDEITDEVLAEYLRGRRGDLVRLMPELTTRLPGLRKPPAADTATERYLMFEAVAELLAAMSTCHPVMLVLDDLQWARSPDLLLLKHIVRSAPPMRVMIVVAYRDNELAGAHPLVPLLADFRHETGIERIALRGLDEQGIVALVADAAGHPLDPAELTLARAIHRDTEGNPLFAGEILRSLQETGAAFGSADHSVTPGAEEFEEWLRERRRVLSAQGAQPGPRLSSRVVMPAAGIGVGAPLASRTADPWLVSTPLPADIVDLSQPAPGFSSAPALAVLRFTNRTGDAANDFLAEGLSEDLIDRLSRLRWLPVIARGSSFSMADTIADPKLVGRRLGARYVVEGCLRHRQNGLSVAASLIDAESGFTLWSHSPRRTIPDSQNALDRFTSELVAALDSRIDHTEQRRAVGNRLGSKDVRDLIWRGRWHLNRLTKADAEIAHALLARALELDPNSPEALIQATFSLGWSIWAGRKSEPQIMEMRKLAQRAILADGDDGRGHMLAGIAEMLLRRLKQAQALLRTAIQLNPSLTLAHAWLGSTLLLGSEPDAALRPLKTALRLSPNDVHAFHPLSELAMCYVMLRRWPEAIEHADQALIRRPAYWHAHIAKITALARSGELQEARIAAKALSIVKPNLTSKDIEWLPFTDRAWIDLLIDVFEMTRDSPAARPSAGENTTHS